MPSETAAPARTGLTLTGEFLSVSEESGEFNGRPWSAGVIKLLDGDFTMRIKFPDLDAAMEALDGVEPIRGAAVTLPVRVQGPWDESAGRRGRVGFIGVRR